MLNQWHGLGRLTSDPELKHTASGVSVASFSIAIDRDYKDQNGEKKTDFIPVIAWRAKADFASRFLRKGRLICVTGRWEQQRWMDQDGNNRTSWQVVAESIYFADGKRQDDLSNSSASQQTSQFTEIDDDEEHPF